MTKRKSGKPGFRPARLSWLLSGLLLSAGIFTVAWFSNGRIAPLVNVGPVAVGGMTRVAAEAAVSEYAAETKLSVRYGGQQWEASVSELGASLETKSSVANAFAVGRGGSRWIPGIQIPIELDWDRATVAAWLRDRVAQVAEVPQDARVTLVDGRYQVVPERSGMVADVTTFERQVATVLATGRGVIDLQLVPQPAEVVADELVQAVADAEAMTAEPIELRVGQQQWIVPTEQQRSWIRFSVFRPTDHPVSALEGTGGQSSVEAAVDLEHVEGYLATLATEINVAPQPEEVIRSRTRVVTLRSGRPGRAVLTKLAADSIGVALRNGSPRSVELPVTDVPPPESFAPVPAAPIPTGKVITVDLTKYHQYLYENGELVYSLKISPGINNWSPTGNFKVYAKTAKQKMSGPDYYVPNVPWILWFKGDYSLHGVYWHNDFGIRPRSHGCIGASIEDAKWVYDWAEVGTPVVIYKS